VARAPFLLPIASTGNQIIVRLVGLPVLEIAAIVAWAVCVGWFQTRYVAQLLERVADA
jgi:hypothetical protein